MTSFILYPSISTSEDASNTSSVSQPPKQKKLRRGPPISNAVSKLHAKLNEFQSDGKYCDLTIHIQQTQFRCHRLVLAAVSEYFDIMLSGNFNESTKKEIELVDVVDANTFSEILKFAYSGITPKLTHSNVYSFLRTGEYLSVWEIEDACTKYIEGNLSSMENIIEIWKFAVATNKTHLMKILISHICQNFRIFANDAELLELSFDELNILLTEYTLALSACTYLRFRDENLTLDVLMRWVHHSQEERLSYFEKLSRLIDYERISAEYKTFFLNNYKVECKKALSDNLCSIVDIDMPPSPVNNYCAPSESKLTLYAYVQYEKENSGENYMRLFSVNEQERSWSGSCHLNLYPTGKIKSVVLEEEPDYFFSFSCGPGIFRSNVSMFCTYTSAKFPRDSKKDLKCPPCHSDLFEICGKRDYIYWYNSNMHDSLNYINFKLETFTQEEVYRGIYSYYSKQDMWLPLPQMKVKLSNACMTADDDLVYLIGGKQPNGEILAGYVQGYDYRTPTWLELPKTHQPYCDAVSCTLNGKIYVSDGKVLEMYNSAAGKWETISRMSQNKNQTHKPRALRMVPFKNLLWIFNEYQQTFIIDPYDQLQKNWCFSTLLDSEIIDQQGYYESENDSYYGSEDYNLWDSDRNVITTEIKDVLVFQNYL